MPVPNVDTGQSKCEKLASGFGRSAQGPAAELFGDFPMTVRRS